MKIQLRGLAALCNGVHIAEQPPLPAAPYMKCLSRYYYTSFAADGRVLPIVKIPKNKTKKNKK